MEYVISFVPRKSFICLQQGYKTHSNTITVCGPIWVYMYTVCQCPKSAFGKIHLNLRGARLQLFFCFFIRYLQQFLYNKQIIVTVLKTLHSASDLDLHCFQMSQKMPLDRSIGQICFKFSGCEIILFGISLQKFLYFK